MSRIFIDELRVDASVGIYPREQAARQTIEMNLEFGVPDAAARQDDIASTIDYAAVIARIRKDLAERHFNLLEALGEHVVSLLCEDFGAPWARIAIAKTGVARGVRRVGVAIERGKRD
ncbi:MAG TPA: dihydroneopterin aldolase [Candidatus Desulfobacillus sp.]|nr:dihydroneopterin aldolase [Candidatus Desulfobacillus sp.]